MDTQFAPMKQLGFPSKELVTPAGKYISKQFAQRKKDLHAKTGLGLNVKTYHAGSSKSRKSKGKTATNVQNSEEQQLSCSSAASTTSSQPPQADRAEKWNLKEMSSYGQYIQEPSYRPSKEPGTPPRSLFSPIELAWPPIHLIALNDQDRLLDLYFEHVHTSMPVLDILTMKQQLANCRAKTDSFLSPLFFYALFALASSYTCKDDPLYHLGDKFMQQAVAHREAYFGYPCISSVLGLLLMVEYLQQTRDRAHASYAWLLAGDAIRMVTDLGIYRPCNVSLDPDDQELAVRTFWAAFTTDRLMSLTYGRPFIFEEKDIGIRLPMISSVEKANFPETDQYLRNFTFLIDVSKVVGRIIRFNFSVQSAQLRVASLHQEAMLSTLDSWTASLIKDAKQCQQTASQKQQQFEIMKQLILHTLLILLHQPYVDHAVPNNNGGPKRNGESKLSFDICTYSAMIITQVTFDLSLEDLQYMIKRSPVVLYALITAMRVHLMNASYTSDQESATHGEFSFLQSLAVVRRIQSTEQQKLGHHVTMQHQQDISLLTRTMDVLVRHFHARPDPILSNYANCQTQIMQSAPFPASYILSMQPTISNSPPSFEQFLTESSTPSSSSASLSPPGGQSSGMFVMDTSHHQHEGINMFNSDLQMGEQGDISLQRTPPPRSLSKTNSGNKHKRFIAFTPGAPSTSSTSRQPNRLHPKDIKQRNNKKRRQSPSRSGDNLSWLQPQEPQQQQQEQQEQVQADAAQFQHQNNFNFLQEPTTTLSSEQLSTTTIQYSDSTSSSGMSEQQMMQQDHPLQLQFNQQQQFEQYQEERQNLYHNHPMHQEQQQHTPPEQNNQLYNNNNPVSTTTTSTYLTPELQQLIDRNPNFLMRASQAAAMASQGLQYNNTQGSSSYYPTTTTTSMFIDPMIQMFASEPTSHGALTNTMVTMTTQVGTNNNMNHNNFTNPVMMPVTSGGGLIPSSGNESLQTYYFSSPFQNNI